MELKLDSLKLGELTIIKTKHEAPKLENKQNNNPVSSEDLDELLFHSTSAPAMNLEDLASITTTKLKVK